jgi:hypothetical protein
LDRGIFSGVGFAAREWFRWIRGRENISGRIVGIVWLDFFRTENNEAIRSAATGMHFGSGLIRKFTPLFIITDCLAVGPILR